MYFTASGIPVDRVYTPDHLSGIVPAPVLRSNAAVSGPLTVISGYEMREAGATALDELAFVVKKGIEQLQHALRQGRNIEEAAGRLCFRFCVQSDFFEEIAKLRAARRLWAKMLTGRFGVSGERGPGVRIEARTSVVRCTAQTPSESVVRAALAVLAASLGGADSVEARLPQQLGSTLAARVAQVIEHETGAARWRDPLGGSYFVEHLTAELERRALDRIGPGGGQPPGEPLSVL